MSSTRGKAAYVSFAVFNNVLIIHMSVLYLQKTVSVSAVCVCVCVYIYIYIYIYVCVCLCVDVPVCPSVCYVPLLYCVCVGGRAPTTNLHEAPATVGDPHTHVCLQGDGPQGIPRARTHTAVCV
jgi:hypothetical protein